MEIKESSNKKDIYKAYLERDEKVNDLISELKKVNTNSVLPNSKVLELENEISKLKNASSDLDNVHKERVDELQNQIDSLTEKGARNDNTPVVVIPYVAAEAQGDELRWSLRGWAKNMPEAKIVIIGDKTPWMDEEELAFIECAKIGANPPMDILNKMQKVIDSELVPEKFIWANDDQYAVNRIYLRDIEMKKFNGMLVNNVKKANGKYKENKQNTIDLLKANDMPLLDFSTHLPVVYEKSNLKEMFERFNMKDKAYLINSIYFNMFETEDCPMLLNIDSDNMKCGIYRQKVSVVNMQRFIKEKKFFNNSQTGFSNVFAKFMNGVFPETCKFELEKK